MNNKPLHDSDFLVSVIVPNYCHSEYLDQRLQSILDQTYQNFELIILDDASLDNGASRAVIEKYRNNPHVSHIVYNEVNSGSTFKQWSKGFALAKGELIWIAESDDFCQKILLESLVEEFVKDSKLVLAYSLSQNVNEEGKMIVQKRRIPHCTTHLNGRSYIKRYMTYANHCCNASACLFRKNILSMIPQLYTTYKAGGDMMFWICIAEHGNVSIINKPINFFRQHNNKVTSSSGLLGINKKEFYKTYQYLINKIRISNWRRILILWWVAYSIDESHYKNENIRQELRSLWGVKPIRSFKKLIIKIRIFLENRLSIYL